MSVCHYFLNFLKDYRG